MPVPAQPPPTTNCVRQRNFQKFGRYRDRRVASRKRDNSCVCVCVCAFLRLDVVVFLLTGLINTWQLKVVAIFCVW